ncbi:DinB family protein [uncultured Arcticibacterium sp.]|uniref:DinB family protein n=1 Tax=uncultured Arcticibacterium sp. TaxID=2173042 RepID=UPI0030F97AB0
MEALISVFTKDLNKLKEEVLSYDSEDALFAIAEGITNSGGNLAMHLNGNLQHFIGAILGKTKYVRNREEEFSGRFSREQIVSDIEESISVVSKTIASLSSEELSSPYPEKIFGGEMKTDFFLYHLLGHLNYHLGQVNYHRRLTTK